MSSKNQPNSPTKNETKPEQKKKERKFQVNNKYDPYVLKACVDEYIIHLLETKQKATELHGHINTKTLLGLLMCGSIALSHYYPLPFPANYFIIIGCVILYLILSGVYTLYETKVIKDVFATFRLKLGDKDQRIEFSSKMERNQEFYEFWVSLPGNRGKENTSKDCREKISVGKLFDVEGKLDQTQVESIVNRCLANLKKLV